MIRGLIFDFDGLILDTEYPQYLSWEEAFVEHGRHLPLDEWSAIIGSSQDAFDPVAYLKKHLENSVDFDDLVNRRALRMQELLDQLTLLPGVLQYLQSAKSMGLKLAVASSSDRKWVINHLTRYQINEYFDAILTADDVERVKPDPMLFLSALKALGLAPDEAIILEDSKNGIDAARAAGIRVVVVPNPLTRLTDLHQADFQIASMAEMPLSDLVGHFNGHNGSQPA